MAEENKAKDINYEDAIGELESIVSRLQSGSVSLDDSLKLYVRGVELAEYCDSRIKEIEQKIAVVNKITGEEEEMPAPRGEDDGENGGAEDCEDMTL